MQHAEYACFAHLGDAAKKRSKELTRHPRLQPICCCLMACVLNHHTDTTHVDTPRKPSALIIAGVCYLPLCYSILNRFFNHLLPCELPSLYHHQCC